MLGLVWQLGPVSAYDVRTQMRRSPSTQWSGSAGAIYPLIRRLARLKLLAARREQVGQRARVRYRITGAGLRVLRAWVGPPISKEAVTVSYDPLRSRARFLRVLTEDQKRSWLKAANEALEEVERRVTEWEKVNAGSGKEYVDELTRHAMLEVAARREWLKGME